MSNVNIAVISSLHICGYYRPFPQRAKHTLKALADIIEYLLAEGYEIVPVSELLLTGEYEIDHAGTMVAKESA